MSNIEIAAGLLSGLVRMGVSEFCVCAGSRNSPLLALLGAAPRITLYSFIDERAAAFFALGRIKLHGKPVAVVTTSGTAVAELLPATVEAHYAKLPLVLVTADRPARYRGTGAPQSIEQVAIFGRYAEQSLERWSSAGPLHLNVEFDEPLIDGSVDGAWGDVDADPVASDPPAVALDDVPYARPLVIVGGLRDVDRDRVRQFLLELGRPAFAEPLSGLREDVALQPLLITAGERVVTRVDYDAVVHIGDVPVLRLWRDLEERLSDVPVMHFTGSFPGLTRGEVYSLDALPLHPAKREAGTALIDRDRAMSARVQSLIANEPRSEVSLIRDLSLSIPAGSRVYLGNSLPIREWDLAATRDSRNWTIEANRGANGIDGQVSTFLGQCDPERSNICIVGDLTAIYDSNAGWILSQLDSRLRFTIYIVNNGGGRIFSRVASLSKMDRDMRNRIVENEHHVRFEAWAAMWGFSYGDPHAARGVVELTPDHDGSDRFWTQYDQLWGRS
jgi:2-succinyl-5-enolpyruvyl-6-hydroxy-3-cyclohexene-1-carboxylate synthase